ncbi:hypothetical protein HPC49_24915 [Pyxidicoccus fallax]|uniref:Lipoprotein n=1 Tax=Pyxidicoccus fallax TaxID=394095 RepID=A0A848LT89_9BACT|nr:hypothetical protein [Pyxidicoccus fallax]NMO20614.1 hypothetical protein [Pyxidicoccus fallax]NPC81457.1 hypothetical protein [Pyxidicoccus fallax]
MSNLGFAGAVFLGAAVAMVTAGCGAGPGDEGESPEVQEGLTDSLASQEQSAAGDTANVCYSNLTPSGWVDVQWWNSAACGSTFVPNTKQIKQLTGYPVGTRVNACASTYPPSGWTITSSYYSSSCQYSAVPSLNNNSWTLVRSF